MKTRPADSRTLTSNWTSFRSMSFPFLPNDVWIPAGPETALNPIASVWIKTSLVNCLAVAPVVPILYGWSLYVAQTHNMSPKTNIHFKGAADALIRTGRGFNLFRGTLPLMAAIPISTGAALAASISGLMATANLDPIESGLTALGAIAAGECLVQPLRYLYFQRVVTFASPLEIAQRTRLSHLSRGLGLTIAASAMVQLSPHFARYLGIEQDPNYQIPRYAAESLIAYALYAMGMKRMCTVEGKTAPTIWRTLRGAAGLPVSLVPRLSLLFAGILSMGASRMIISTLQVHMSAKATALPF